ncbi:hypothetical protein GQX74_014644 [Glossina fuscipes]|nr:hypothetical protein GQX74_014644 [Glossina fuscipes]
MHKSKPQDILIVLNQLEMVKSKPQDILIVQNQLEMHKSKPQDILIVQKLTRTAQRLAQLTTYQGRVYLVSKIGLQRHQNNTLENPNTNIHLGPPGSKKLTRIPFGYHPYVFGWTQTPKKA